MERRRFGTTGLDVPVIGMGTWQTFDVRGSAVAKRREVADAAFETGATLFDSSPMYGEAEHVLGSTLEGRRDQAIVATKVWTADDREAEQQIGRALGYFGGRVDIYQVHNLLAWSKRLSQLERLKARGAVRVIGITHYSRHAFREMLQVMADPRVQAIQVPYNPREREIEKEILPAAADLGLGVLVMRPFGEGSLLDHASPSRRPRAASSLRRHDVAAGAPEVDSERPPLPRRDSCNLEPCAHARERRRGRAAVVR